jgi:hypothetical protein
MKKFRVAMLVMVILPVLIPTAAYAAVYTYYCSWDVGTGGDGSYDYPWQCRDDVELDIIVDDICVYLDYDDVGILYQIQMDGYWKHWIEWDGKECGVVNSKYFRGYPPDTGIALPPPLLFGGAMALGLSLFAVGLVVFRKRVAN